MDYMALYVQLREGIEAHPYLTIIAVSVVEARVTSVFAGMFVAQGYVNPIIAYVIFIVMCFLGDTLYYFLGRTGHAGARFLHRKKWHRLAWVREKMNGSLPWALVIGKVSGIASKPAIVAAGIGKMPFAQFCRITTPCTLVMFLVYMTLGYFFGQIILRYLL